MSPAGPEPESVELGFAGSYLRVEVEQWAGGVRREVVRHPGACAAVLFGSDGRVVLVRQFREAVRRVLLEVPAGIRDVAGEAPEETMRREILEETGLQVERIERLGSILTTPGFTDERIDLFVAWAGDETPVPPSEREVQVEIIDFQAALRMVAAGEIQDAKSCVALLLAEHRRESGRYPGTPAAREGDRA